MKGTRKKGQSLVEFALVLPLLLLILVGIIEFGFMFSNYLTMTNASREAVRYISLGSTDGEAIQRAMVVSDLLEEERLIITITPAVADRGRGDSVTVIASYQYRFITPILSSVMGGTMNLRTEATMRVE